MIKKIYFGGGCFWGVEHFFNLVFKDKIKTTVGYLNSNIENPNYEKVYANLTNTVEVVEIIYDDKDILLSDLINVFFLIIDPTSLNQQKNDKGSQYRTGIYSNDSKILEEASEQINLMQINYDKEIVVEIKEVQNYYLAEKYHQKYLIKNPNGYCHIDMSLLKKIKLNNC